MKPDLSQYEQQHVRNLQKYMRDIKQHYNVAISRISTLYGATAINREVPFQLSQYPALKQALEGELRQLANKMSATISNGIENEWTLSNNKNDRIVGLLVGGKTIPTRLQEQYLQRNLEALAAFKSRTEAGLKLSERVWSTVKGYSVEVERAMAIGIENGTSAADLARDMKQYLNEPDKLFRRVRDSEGKLRLSKAAREYEPGRGKYRSSYKNAMRVSRTEINKAYRTADIKRYQQLDFVLGYEVRRSNRGYDCDVCEQLKGEYPKSFVFDSWHPHCLCFVIPITPDPDKFFDEAAKVNPDYGTPIKDTPAGFNDFVKANPDYLSTDHHHN